jgi:hypothetical protein
MPLALVSFINDSTSSSGVFSNQNPIIKWHCYQDIVIFVRTDEIHIKNVFQTLEAFYLINIQANINFIFLTYKMS